MTFWCGSGSGSADPCLWLMDPDPVSGSGSCYFRHRPLRCQQKNNFFKTLFSVYYFLKVHLHHLSKIKSQKDLQNSRNQGFSYYFCMMIEGSGSIPLTNGSGSGRPENMWIRWIRNTGCSLYFSPHSFKIQGENIESKGNVLNYINVINLGKTFRFGKV